MSKEYRVKRKIKKKNTLVLIVIAVLVAFGFGKMIKGVSQEQEVLATGNNIKSESNINKKDSSKKETPPVKKEKPAKTHFTVVVDASFGGSDGGSRGYNGILQKDVNLQLALKMRDILEKHKDIDVILTRDSDKTLSMKERADIINNSKADLVVSIMQNTEGSGDVSGVETYVLPRENEKSNTTFGYVLQQAMTMYVDTKDRGVLARNMNILTDSNVPGAVVNTGFITNKKEGSNLASEKYQLRLAEGISQGILSYIDRYLKEN